MYLLLTLSILLLLNFYPVYAARELVFQSKQSSVLNKAQMVATSLSGLESLNADTAEQVMDLLEDVNSARIVITDGEGFVLYDSVSGGSTVGRYVLFPEVVTALEGSDVFHCLYHDGMFESHAAIPVMYHSSPIGAVYLLDLDTEEAALIWGIQSNTFTISLVILAAVLLVSGLFSVLLSRRVQSILHSVRIAREGEYTHKVDIRGRDELGELAAEFNRLTDRLQATEKLRHQFVADASHELKTPLASIRLLSDSILQNPMDEETLREFVSDIGDEADRLARMTNKLLTLTRIDSDPERVETIVDPAVTVSKVFRMLTPLANMVGVTLLSTMDEGCTVLSNEDDMYQVVFNLVENAIKYNRREGSVNVLLYRRDEDVVLHVEDCGVGIPEEEIPHIFERFYRVDKARSREAGGTGLGLAIVHDVVLRHGGTVSAANRQQGGTRFTVVFPYRGAEEVTP
jgi:signal transduction histidine kinase